MLKRYVRLLAFFVEIEALYGYSLCGSFPLFEGDVYGLGFRIEVQAYHLKDEDDFPPLSH